MPSINHSNAVICLFNWLMCYVILSIFTLHSCGQRYGWRKLGSAQRKEQLTLTLKNTHVTLHVFIKTGLVLKNSRLYLLLIYQNGKLIVKRLGINSWKKHIWKRKIYCIPLFSLTRNNDFDSFALKACFEISRQSTMNLVRLSHGHELAWYI